MAVKPLQRQDTGESGNYHRFGWNYCLNFPTVKIHELAVFISYPEYGVSKFLRKVYNQLPDYTVL